MSGSGQQPQQSTTTVLGPEQKQLFSLAMPGLTQFAAHTPQRYQGETVAGFTPNQVAGTESMIQGSQLGSQATIGRVNAALDTAQNLPNTLDWTGKPLVTSSDVFNDPGIWNPANNAGMRAAIDAAQRPLYNQLNESVLPGLKSDAVLAGGLGGSRQGVAEGLAAGKTATAAGDVGAKIAEDLYGANLAASNARYATNIGAENQRYATDQARYGTNVSATLQALGLTPQLASSLNAAYIQPGAIQASVGEQQQALEQARINAQVQGYNYDQLAPMLQSKEILSLLQGMPGGTTVSTGNVPQANPFTTALGGAAAGAAVGSAIPGIGTGIGAGVGAGGALLPFLFH